MRPDARATINRGAPFFGWAVLFGTYTNCASRVLSPRYERRFVELYDQVEEKLYETRKYFVTYKMLERTKVFLEKEVCRQGSITRVQRNTSNNPLLLIPVALLCVWGWAQESLIHSINDNFVKSMKSKSGRQAFLKQCITIVQGLQVTLADADLPAQCHAARTHTHTYTHTPLTYVSEGVGAPCTEHLGPTNAFSGCQAGATRRQTAGVPSAGASQMLTPRTRTRTLS